MSGDEALLRGDRVEVARALSDAESTLPDARGRTRARLARLSAAGAIGRAHAVGITGPPGVGKSTLASAIVRALRGAPSPRSVGVLAVDPSSVRSGGALLGDRVRMALDPRDAGAFVRSVASGGELGGLARSVPVQALLLSAAFDVVLVETVGIGQSEADARDVVDTLVFVLQPGSGDAVQFLKAGIMEVPDLLVVNKADHPAARETTRELRGALAALGAAGVLVAAPEVLETDATRLAGVDALVAAVDTHARALDDGGRRAAARVEGAASWVLAAFARRHGSLGVDAAGGPAALRGTIRAGLLSRRDPLSVLDGLLRPPPGGA